MVELAALSVNSKVEGVSYLEEDDLASDVVQTFYEDPIVWQVELLVCEEF